MPALPECHTERLKKPENTANPIQFQSKTRTIPRKNTNPGNHYHMLPLTSPNPKRIDTIQPPQHTMKLLLDEMYTGLKDHLNILGWEVETVRDAGITGKQDREIAEHAKKHGLLLVTQDQKPAELADLLHAKNVLITTASIAAMVDREIREKYPETR